MAKTYHIGRGIYFMAQMVPVSYTHLDVYKRQLMTWATHVLQW